MYRKLPIRTYGKEKCKEVTVSLKKLHIPVINISKESSVIELSDNNNSVFCDPFDTTFDKLLKNTRALEQPSKSDTTKASKRSKGNSSVSSSNVSSIIDDKCLLYKDTEANNVSSIYLFRPRSQEIGLEASNVNIKHNLRKRPQRKVKVKKKIVKKHIQENSPIIGKTRVREHSIYKKKVYKGKRNKNVHSIELSLELKSNDNNDTKILDQNTNMKQKERNNKGKISKEQSKSVEVIEANVGNLKCSNVPLKNCFVKIEHLEASLFVKPLHSIGNVVSSTPSSKPIRPSTHIITLSPIPITYNKIFNEPVRYTRNSSVSVNNTNLVSSKDVQLNTNVCEQSDTSKEHVLKENKRKLFVKRIDASDSSKCSLNKLGRLQKDKSILSIELSCVSMTQEASEKFCDIEESISTSKKKDKDLWNEPPLLIDEHVITNREQKKHLNFSVDPEGSRSLFDNTNEDDKNSLCNISAKNNLINNYKELSDTMCSDVTKSCKTSVSHVYDSEIEEKSCDVLPTSKLQGTNISLDAEECKSKTEGLDVENLCTSTLYVQNCTSTSKETKDFSTIDDKLNANSTIAINNKSSNALEPCIISLQLQDPFRITRRRKQYRKWELDLDNISEDVTNSFRLKRTRLSEKRVTDTRRTNLSRKTLKSLENIQETSILNISAQIERPIYLKPGKSWTRSLSILNNIPSESNLDKLSIGKGKQWRQSVIDVFNMQKEGVFHSCIRKTESDKNLQASHETISQSEHELINKKGRTCDSTSLGRLTRRISVRVVPINKTVKSIEDASFLEVYGIVPVKSQRFTLLSNPRKSSLCNIQNDDIDGHITDEYVISPAKEVILGRCLQQDFIPFSIYFSDSYLSHCRKIGEGVYGEVFLYELGDEKSVIKIIPIEGNEYVNGEPQKKFHEILSEIVIATELHNLRFNTKYNTDGFVEVKNIKCLKGEYPKKLVDLWTIYDEEKHSENDCPSMFNENQLYIILELGHGGQDLEAFVFPSADEAYALFIQAALALAVAEKAVEFEHRDLHWGNILISPTTESHVHYKLGKTKIQLVSKGVKVSIIDFTLSRVTYQGCSVFNDLASDPSLFTAQGEYQFEIYRLMRDKIKNNWQKFEPYSNILWLHYTLDKMITAVRYRKRNLKIHKNGIVKLKELKNEILSYESAFDFVSNCRSFESLLFTASESELVSALKEEMVIA
ncbi:haspin [Lasioglossum baleicum]|uniref:haspin n=1 Tax=Lasioglossum baleicum TaxID=434251 RepID=UPI003FCEBE51